MFLKIEVPIVTSKSKTYLNFSDRFRKFREKNYERFNRKSLQNVIRWKPSFCIRLKRTRESLYFITLFRVKEETKIWNSSLIRFKQFIDNSNTKVDIIVLLIPVK